MKSEQAKSKDRSGRPNTVPHASLLVALHHELACGAAVSDLHIKYGITERTLYRYKKTLRTGRHYLRALWWLNNQPRIQEILGHGRCWSDVFRKLKPPTELFSSLHALHAFIRFEEIREIEDRNAA